MAFFQIPLTPDVSSRSYVSVPASSQDESDHVIPDGITYEFTRFYGQSSVSPDTIICIFWDKDGGEEDLLFTAHGEGLIDLPRIQKTGDGVKKVKIILGNDLTQAEWLGCGWEAIIK
jgi:hypothetical protein